ncbi:MAG: AarF/ABC1/UbiB kinase family protein [Pirellulales bacterium]|nr:AarF/ABC1/UbiB kinase family protein [Pirellulales bacterium]
MKLTALPQYLRNSTRAVEVVSILSKYGLANWVSRLDSRFADGLFKSPNGEVLARYTPAVRLRLALTELGPTFIKLGQILSTRPDLVGVEVAGELSKLQADAPADSFEQVRETIEAEMGQPLEEIFAEFDETPLASASIGQVHRAQLVLGQRVVVKVQHAGIDHKIRKDLAILGALAELAELIPEFKNYRPRETTAEFQRTLLRELDFGREERNMQEFSGDFVDDPRVHIPRTFPELTTGRVLTMEELEGIKLSEPERLLATRADLTEIARRGAELYMEMIFTHGFYHADPHPGNILILEGGVIGLLDYGMVGRIDESLREDIEEMLGAIVDQDPVHLTSIITRIGKVPAGLDTTALSIEVTDYVALYANRRLDEFRLGAALNDLTELVRRYHIMLPARVALLIKVFVMLEGTAQLLNPRFNLIEVIAPYQKKLLWRRLSPTRRLRKLRRLYRELELLAQALPRGIVDILEQVQTGKFDVHLDHRGLEPSVNRLVFGLLTSALFLGSTLLLSRHVPPLLRGVSVLGAAGCAVSLLLGLRLVRAINKSGHLDRRR